ncbi:serine/threonine-protein phosphatase [Cellulomonas fimi]|uniref:PP2C family protein-serine/threonine phosphatase n=1 Tax=Cellulomonas fimi TaxID=1708 RepID=UPI00234DDCAB|nr:PP2C family protein-serine/threonine phosphatase [Cellulomonas fimi]MDC7121612.1 serine/threonine-protein phosphatase [Cellulomonas fimi]
MTDDRDSGTLAALRTFLDDVHLATPDGVAEAAHQAAAALGWSARLYVVDYEQRYLVPMPTSSLPDADAVPIEGTLAGRAFQHVEPVPASGHPGMLWVPLLDGVHRFGVVQLTVPPDTDLDDPGTVDRYELLCHLVGHMLAAKNPYGDALDMLARRRPRAVATELLSDLLPPLTFGCEGLVVSGILEPCYDVAADAFDYGVVDSTAHLAVLDATGHDLSGTLVAAVAVAACRNSRRERRTLYETASAVDDALREQWRGTLFASGVLAELDLDTGRLRYVNAGHPAPLLMRDGKVVKRLDGGRRIVLGLGDGQIDVAEEWLERGDWVVFYTDGVTEARGADGAFYGVERLTDQLRRSAAAGYPVPETLRRVVHEVLDHQQGRLQDDATLLVAQWATRKEDALRAAPS